MGVSQDDIVTQMRDALQLSDPELDTGVGTPARKILDAVAGSIAGAYIEQHLLSYAYDVDSKIDADLDAFTQLFGIARIAARRSVGTVTFSRTGDLTATVFIPVGTEVSTADSSVVVQTVTGGTMMSGAASVTVAVQAVVAGPEGNLAAGAATLVTSPIQGVNAVVNTAAFTGGMNRETDSELRARWKATVFRSLAGTEQMYLGVALDDGDCYAATVVGASRTRTEILQVPVSGDVVTQITDAKYIYASPVQVSKADGTALAYGYDYQWIASNPPTIHPLSGAFPAAGELITVEYQYLPVVSRNDPSNTITNRVDLFVGGTRAQSAQVGSVFRQANVFVSTPTSATLYTGNWIRNDQTAPTAGNVFVPLPYGPILTVPATLSIGGTTYGLATAANPLGTVSGGVTYAYQVVHDSTVNGYTATSQFGLEWHHSYLPADGSAFNVGANGDYTYNEVPASVQDAVNRWRLTGVDARVHQAQTRWLRFTVGLMYTSTATGSAAAVQDAVRAALSDFLGKLGFNAAIQVSDVLEVIHQVPGVDNVRLLNGSDVTGYNPANPNASIVGIQQIVAGSAPASGAIVSYVDSTTGRAKDVYLKDNELPVLGGIVFKTLARNSFGVL